MFNRQPTLSDGIYLLRPLAMSDRAALRAAASDPLIWIGHPDTERYKPDVFNRLFDNLMAFKGAMVVTKDGAVIGSSTYYTGSTQPGTIAIGYSFLTRVYWGGDANRAVKTLLMDHAFTAFDAIWFHIGPDNIRSQKATEKLGGIYSHAEIMDTSSGPVTMVYYKITRSAWRDRIGK